MYIRNFIYKIILSSLFIVNISILSPLEAISCDVAVISSSAAKNGKPLIWKNRDDPVGFFIGVRKYKAANPEVGSYLCVEEKYFPDNFSLCSAGVNEAGFAVANTDAYTGSNIEGLLNVDTFIMEEALNNCKTVACFEDILTSKHDKKGKFYATSSNFVVMDAYGGAIHYEAYAKLRKPVEIIKHDVNILNFSNKTNYVELHDIHYDHTSIQRSERGTELLEKLYAENELTAKNIMHVVAKDVCEDNTTEDWDNFNTDYCISRAYTVLSIVIEGVEPYSDPAYSTMWVNLGEASIGIFVPIYPAAQSIPKEVKMTAVGSSPFNLAIMEKEAALYDNNGIANKYIEFPYVKDRTMDKTKLLDIQKVSFAIEDMLIDVDQKIKETLKNDSTLNIKSTLDNFSHYGSQYAYTMYTGGDTTPNMINIKAFRYWLKAIYKNAGSFVENILGF